MLLAVSGKATAAAGLRGLVPFKSSCLKSCSRMGSIFFGMVTNLPTARACTQHIHMKAPQGTELHHDTLQSKQHAFHRKGHSHEAFKQ